MSAQINKHAELKYYFLMASRVEDGLRVHNQGEVDDCLDAIEMIAYLTQSDTLRSRCVQVILERRGEFYHYAVTP